MNFSEATDQKKTIFDAIKIHDAALRTVEVPMSLPRIFYLPKLSRPNALGLLSVTIFDLQTNRMYEFTLGDQIVRSILSIMCSLRFMLRILYAAYTRAYASFGKRKLHIIIVKYNWQVKRKLFCSCSYFSWSARQKFPWGMKFGCVP